MGDNPNWKPFLDVLPEMLHAQVKPILEQWDQGVNQKLASERDKYAPYKDIIDNKIDPGYLAQALALADQIQDDPAEVIARMNTTFNLGYLDPDAVAELQQTSPNTDLEDDLGLGEDMVNLQDNPEFKALQQGIEALTGKLTEMTQKQELDEETKNFQSYMEQLHTEHGEFNDRFVTALIAQGLEGPAAIEEYRKEIAAAAGDGNNTQQTQQEQANNGTPPVVLGGGPAGSGSDQTPIDFGAMKGGDVNSYVADLLKNAGNTQS